MKKTPFIKKQIKIFLSYRKFSYCILENRLHLTEYTKKLETEKIETELETFSNYFLPLNNKRETKK